MALTEAPGKMSVLEGMIKMIVRVIFPRIVPHPFVAARVDVWRLRMAFLIDVCLSLLRSAPLLRRCDIRGRSFWRGGRPRMRRRAWCGDVPPAYSAYTTAALLLCGCGNYNQQERKGQAEKVFHLDLLDVGWNAIGSCAQSKPSSGGHTI